MLGSQSRRLETAFWTLPEWIARFNDNSDVDLIVDFNKAEVSDYFDNFFDFKYALENLFGRKVDLLEEQTIKNPYLKKNVDATKTLIYG